MAMNCGYVEVLECVFMEDLPNVTVSTEDDRCRIQICASSKWRRFRRLSELFVSIFSHETIHAVLSRFDLDSAYAFDDVGSVSTLSLGWRGLSKAAEFYHGIIGVE